MYFTYVHCLNVIEYIYEYVPSQYAVTTYRLVRMTKTCLVLYDLCTLQF
jgi:hypothetical protein